MSTQDIGFPFFQWITPNSEVSKLSIQTEMTDRLNPCDSLTKTIRNKKIFFSPGPPHPFGKRDKTASKRNKGDQIFHTLMRYHLEFLIHSFYVFLWHLRGNFRVFQIVPESCYRAQDECVTNRFVIGREKFKWSLWRSWSSGPTSWIWGRTNHWKMSAQESQVENLKFTSLIKIILLRRFYSIILPKMLLMKKGKI